jgi:predicted component of type VI protein secretion system
VILDRGAVRASGASGDAALHRVLIDVFGGAIRVERFEERWIVIPHLARR